MKGLLALVLVLVLGWLGATWYVGMRAEEIVRSEVSNLSLLPGRDDIVLDVVRYDRGLFSSEADTCLVIQGDLAALAGGADLTGTLCMNSTIYHGPLIFADGVALGLAATRDAFDVSALPPSGKAVLEEIFKGRAPLEGRSFYGFDGSLTATLEMPPVDVESPMGKLELKQFSVDMVRPSANSYPLNSYLTIKGFHADSPKGAISLDSLSGSMDVVAMLDDEVPLTNVNLASKGFSYIQDGLTLLAFDAILQGNSQDKGAVLNGNSGIWLENAQAPLLPIPMDSAYIGMDFEGIDKAALVRLNRITRELDQVQTAMALSAISGEGAEDINSQIERMQTLMDDMMGVMSEKLLKPGDSTLRMKMLVDLDGKRQFTFDSKARYLGLEGKNLPFHELMMLDESELNTMLDMTVHLDVADSVIPVPLLEQLQAYEAQGLVVHENDRWRGDINARGDSLIINGKATSVAEVKALIETLNPPPQGDDLSMEEMYMLELDEQ